MLIGSRQRIATVTESLDLSINGISLKKVNCSKCLGVELDKFLSWDSHITSVCKKVSSGIGVLKKIKPFIPSRSLINIYQSIVEPYFGYCSIVWNGISEGLAEKLQKLQNRAARIITGSHYMAPTKDMLEKLGWTNLEVRRNKQKALMMFKIINGMTPVYLKDMFSKNIGTSCYNLRTSRENIALPRARTGYYRNSSAFTGAKIWNSLPNDLKCERSLQSFKKQT